jgi:hypothetical protein
MRRFAFLGSMVFCFAVLAVAYAILKSLAVPIGSFGDWVFGLLSFFWLMAVVTVPWNIYFKARDVLADAAPSRERGLPVDDRQVTYVSTLARRALWIAIGLHLFSALSLFLLAVFGVSQIGYIASVLALLLTGLRPAASAYEYLVARLRSIGQQWHYPHEDVIELRGKVTAMESMLEETRRDLDLTRPESLAARLTSQTDQLRQEIGQLTADLATLRAENENEHERLSREAKGAIAQLSTDSQFLEHVREILRFFKSA